MSSSIDYPKFFYADDPLANRPLRLGTVQEWVTIDSKNLLFYGDWQPPEPVIFKAYMGGQITDILWSGFPPLVVFSQRLIDLLLENGFTGWSTYPVKVYGRHGEFLPGYHGFAIKSFAGKQDLSRSQTVVNPPFSQGCKPREVFKGFYFDENKWDGSDLFRVTAVYTIATKRVIETLKKAKIINIRFIPIEDVEIPTYLYKKIDNI